VPWCLPRLREWQKLVTGDISFQEGNCHQDRKALKKTPRKKKQIIHLLVISQKPTTSFFRTFIETPHQMKKIIFSAIIAIAFLTSCGSGTPSTKTDSAAKADSAKAHPTADKYQCPMKCEGDKTYDKPGNCPVCQMQMKKVSL
jgi:Cu2+-exporting ATPase